MGQNIPYQNMDILWSSFETGLLEIAEVNSNDGAIKAFETVLNQIHGKTYYHLLSAERLNIDFNTLFFNGSKIKQRIQLFLIWKQKLWPKIT